MNINPIHAMRLRRFRKRVNAEPNPQLFPFPKIHGYKLIRLEIVKGTGKNWREAYKSLESVLDEIEPRLAAYRAKGYRIVWEQAPIAKDGYRGRLGIFRPETAPASGNVEIVN